MKLLELRKEEDFEGLRSEWNGLLSQSASRTFFLTWEWIRSWWSAYGYPGDLRILAAFDAGGVLRGIAPLRHRKVYRYGQSVSALSFLGDGPISSDLDCSDCLDFIVAPGYERPVMEAFHKHCTNFQVLRNLESRTEVRLAFCDTASQLEKLLAVLFDPHTRRRAREGENCVLGQDAKWNFYLSLSCLLLERRWLRFSYLEWEGQVLAYQYGLIYHNIYSQVQEGYEPASEHLTPDIALRAWSIRELLKEGIVEYDVLGGMNRYKSDRGGDIQHRLRILMARRSYKNLFARCRKTAPRRPVTSDCGWARQMAAGCYLYSGMPSLSRRLRERYQLSVSPIGSRQKFSWHSRNEPAARILYYHRVNDEDDAFFEAVSTRAFGGQMQYLARHHKVASIPEIMRHLEESESTETLIGITFDDGYRDNYENAFPILQRYGLPATIFLTTGSIDSGEPLWFERLAEAVKRTTREYLDLEIDVPRRFWMRTLPERVLSGRQIFLLLRSLEDAERKQRLAEIWKQLGMPSQSERRNKMLTWEQVRLMKAHGIDFGGHTVTHPFLSRLTCSAADWELSECKRRIEEELQQRVLYFAYPNGREEDIGPSNTELVRAAGYRAAMTLIWGMNYPSTDRMRLRRGGPWENNLALFALKLDWYQLTNQ